MGVMEGDSHLDAIYIMCVCLGVCVCPQMTKKERERERLRCRRGEKGREDKVCSDEHLKD